MFPEKRAFGWRPFGRFDEIADEFAAAELVFLSSNQLESLPSECVDAILNISSLHEMRPDQISYYFDQFNKVLRTDGIFYTKQWRHAKVLFEGVSLVEGDYPIPAGWRQLFSRIARVQTEFFEALYKKERISGSELEFSSAKVLLPAD